MRSLTAPAVSLIGCVGALGEVSVDWLIQSVSQISTTGSAAIALFSFSRWISDSIIHPKP